MANPNCRGAGGIECVSDCLTGGVIVQFVVTAFRKLNQLLLATGRHGCQTGDGFRGGACCRGLGRRWRLGRRRLGILLDSAFDHRVPGHFAKVLQAAFQQRDVHLRHDRLVLLRVGRVRRTLEGVPEGHDHPWDTLKTPIVIRHRIGQHGRVLATVFQRHLPVSRGTYTGQCLLNGIQRADVTAVHHDTEG